MFVYFEENFVHLDVGEGCVDDYEGFQVVINKDSNGTVDLCFNACKEYRKSNGEEWNGMCYTPSSGHCMCLEKDRDHKNYNDSLHYRWE